MNKRVLILIPAKNVQDEELITTLSILENAGVAVTLASPSEKVTGQQGGQFIPHLTIDQAEPSDYDMVVCIGGMGSYDHYDDPQFHNLLHQFQKRDRLISAICGAPGILAKAGILNGVEATCYPDPSTIAVLEDHGAAYVEKDVVVHRRIITGNGPQASGKFAQALVEGLRQGASL